MKTGLHHGITAAVNMGGNGVMVRCRQCCIPLLALVLKAFFLSSLPQLLPIPTALFIVDIIRKLILSNKVVLEGSGDTKGWILVA